MLFIVMHTNNEYLGRIQQLILEQDVSKAAIVEREGLGASIAEGNDFNIFSAGHMLPRYNKAVIAVLKDKRMARDLLKVIDSDMELKMLNMENKGFICTLPHSEIEGLENTMKKGETMRISDYLKENVIKLDINALEKEDAIIELGEMLREAEPVEDFDSFMRDIFEREKLYTTGIGNEVALPHARTDNVSNFVIALGRSKDGVNFNAIDQQPVKLIFLMGTPQNSGMQSYLHILAHLNRLLQKGSFRQNLINAGSAAEIIEIFKKAEA